MSRAAFLLLTLTFALVLPTSDAEVLTNDDIQKLTSAGLPPAVIVAKIASSESDFDTSVDALVALATGGVDGSVIEAMTTAGVERQTARDIGQSTSGPTGFDTTPCHSAGVFFEQSDGALGELESTAYLSAKAGGLVSGLTAGAVTSRTLAVLRRTASPVRMTERSPVFWFCFDSSGNSFKLPGITDILEPQDLFLVPVKANAKKDQRTWVRGRQDINRKDLMGTPKGVVPMNYEAVAHGVYRVSPHNPLSKSEYAFYKGTDAVTSRRAFAFGVD